MIEEYSFYRLIYGVVKQVYKINESRESLTQHTAAQLLTEKRNMTIEEAYKYLRELPFH